MDRPRSRRAAPWMASIQHHRILINQVQLHLPRRHLQAPALHLQPVQRLFTFNQPKKVLEFREWEKTTNQRIECRLTFPSAHFLTGSSFSPSLSYSKSSLSRRCTSSRYRAWHFLHVRLTFAYLASFLFPRRRRTCCNVRGRLKRRVFSSEKVKVAIRRKSLQKNKSACYNIIFLLQQKLLLLFLVFIPICLRLAFVSAQSFLHCDAEKKPFKLSLCTAVQRCRIYGEESIRI